MNDGCMYNAIWCQWAIADQWIGRGGGDAADERAAAAFAELEFHPGLQSFELVPGLCSYNRYDGSL